MDLSSKKVLFLDLEKAACSVFLGAQYPDEKMFYVNEINEGHSDKASKNIGIGKVDVTGVF